MQIKNQTTKCSNFFRIVHLEKWSGSAFRKKVSVEQLSLPQEKNRGEGNRERVALVQNFAETIEQFFPRVRTLPILKFHFRDRARLECLIDHSSAVDS